MGLSSTLAAQQGISEDDLDATLEKNVSTLTKDPVYSDVVYVHHAFGVHSLHLAPWLEPLATALDKGDEHAAEKALTHGLTTRVSPELLTMSMASEPLPVAGLAIVTDIYLGYTLLMLTSLYQLFARERPLIADSPEIEDATASIIQDKPLQMDDEQAPSYVSLLSRPSFEPPSPLDKPSHASGVPQFAMPPDISTREGVKVTPEALRFLGRTIETLRSTMHNLVNAGTSVQSRFDQQCKELSRQLGKISEMHENVLDSEERAESVTERITQAQERQKDLLARSDRVLQRLLDSKTPELSKYELQWFEELEHLQGEVAGDGQLGTLRNRLTKVAGQVKVLKQQEQQRQASGPAKNGAADSNVSKMGKTQVQRVEAMLDFESVSLSLRIHSDHQKQTD